jgi:hypothetical protein
MQRCFCSPPLSCFGYRRHGKTNRPRLSRPSFWLMGTTGRCLPLVSIDYSSSSRALESGEYTHLGVELSQMWGGGPWRDCNYRGAGGARNPPGLWITREPRVCSGERAEKQPPASCFVESVMSSVGTGYPQIVRVIHRKRRVIHRCEVRGTDFECGLPPYLGATRVQEPGVGGVDIGSGAVEAGGTDHLPLP